MSRKPLVLLTLLLAAACYARSSERFHRRLVEHPWLGSYIRQREGMSARQKAVEEAGGTPKLLSPKPGKVQAFHHLDKADTFEVDVPVGEADHGTFDALRPMARSRPCTAVTRSPLPC